MILKLVIVVLSLVKFLCAESVSLKGNKLSWQNLVRDKSLITRDESGRENVETVNRQTLLDVLPDSF